MVEDLVQLVVRVDQNVGLGRSLERGDITGTVRDRLRCPVGRRFPVAIRRRTEPLSAARLQLLKQTDAANDEKRLQEKTFGTFGRSHRAAGFYRFRGER